MIDEILIALFLGMSYLIGSIPFGLLLTRLFRLGDLHKIGSGNIGATNVMRTGHKGAGFLTLLFDGGKGALMVLLCDTLFDDDILTQMAALAAFLGHLYPIWLRFRGGKGVATYLGILLTLTPPIGVLACLTWLLAFIALRISSVASMTAVILAPLWLFLFSRTDFLALTLVMSIFVVAHHHQNIRRLWKGTESRVELFKRTPDQ